MKKKNIKLKINIKQLTLVLKIPINNQIISEKNEIDYNLLKKYILPDNLKINIEFLKVQRNLNYLEKTQEVFYEVKIDSSMLNVLNFIYMDRSWVKEVPDVSYFDFQNCKSTFHDHMENFYLYESIIESFIIKNEFYQAIANIKKTK